MITRIKNDKLKIKLNRMVVNQEHDPWIWPILDIVITEQSLIEKKCDFYYFVEILCMP